MGWGDKVDGTELSAEDLLRGIAAIKKANGITTDAAWSTFIDGRTDAQMLTLLRSFFKLLVKVSS